MNIKYFGSKSQREKTEAVVSALPLTGNEATDRLIIQDALDKATGTGSVLYDGNTVYPKKRLVNELKKLKHSNNLKFMSNRMYEFLTMNFDYAHYNKQGYIADYDGKFDKVYELIRTSHIPSWHTDVIRIIEELN